MTRERAARAAAEVEHGCAFRKEGDKALMPRLVVPHGAGAISVPGDRVAFVVTDDPIGKFAHRDRLTMRVMMLKKKPRHLGGGFFVMLRL